MKYSKITILIIFLIFSYKTIAQVPSFGGGLAFSSGIDLNGLTTGNPAVYARGFFKLNKQLKIVPGITAFSPRKKFYPTYPATLKNYMFQGDIDAHLSIYRDDPLRFIAFAGLNATSVISKWDNLVSGAKNVNDLNLGLNLGLALYMFVNNSYDAYISGKYIAGPASQVIINVGIVFYPEGLRRKGGW